MADKKGLIKRARSVFLLALLLFVPIQLALASFVPANEPVQPVEASYTETLEKTTPSPSPSPLPTPDPTEPPRQYGATSKSGVNVRSETNTNSKAVAKLTNTGSAFIILGQVESSGDVWYQVELSSGSTGYIRGDLVQKITATEYETKQAEAQSAAAKKNQSSSTSSKSSGGGSVWIPTRGGTKYHASSSCSGMKGPMKVSVSEARSRGFSACKKCY